MPQVCPRACSRLATAAVFLSVGVVQFVVGIILLRAKYVYLLAGPDFWTSCCNIAVGCLLGISATVWKQSKKRQSKKHTIRRHILLALIFSAFIMNSTTLAILLLVEDDTLVSIRLQSDGRHNETSFNSEVLAYAYVTSVCCPVVCIVISIVDMSGSCFISSRKNSIERKFSFNSLKKSRTDSLQWVYAPEKLDLSKNKARDLVLTSSSEESSDSDFEDMPIKQKHTTSIEELQSVLNRMAEGKRDSILNDSTIMLRQLDQRRKSRVNSLNQDGSYIGPAVSRIKESSLGGTSVKVLPSVYTDQNTSKNDNSQRFSSEFREHIRSSSGDITLKPLNRSRNNRNDVLLNNSYAREVMKDDDSVLPIAKNSSQYKDLKGKQTRPKICDDFLISDTTDYNVNGYVVDVPVKSRKTSQNKSIEKPSSECNLNKDCEVSQGNQQRICKSRSQIYEITKQKELESDLKDCFSPGGSEFSADTSLDLSAISPWAGELVPVNVNNSTIARLSQKLIPVASPVVPNILQEHDHHKMSDDSGIFSVQSTSFNSDALSQSECDKDGKFSSFRENGKTGCKEYPKAGSQSLKKYDLSRVVTMASISEEPNSEVNVLEPQYSSSNETGTPKTPMKHNRRQSLPSTFLESKGQEEEEYSERNRTPKRKASVSGKALRKLWSLANPPNQPDFLEQVVDGDSLIGLSEEELIARQKRNRSIRASVQQRIKEEMTLKKKYEHSPLEQKFQDI